MATTKVSTKLLETVGVSEGGTGSTSSSAARTALGLVIGTNVLAPNGNAASLTNLPAGGASAAEAANIMINSFNIAAAGGFAYQNMVDGVVDEFEDATGVDASTSTNESYNATDDFYKGSPGASYGSDTTSGQTFTSSGGSSQGDAFDNNTGTQWSEGSSGTSTGAWLKVEFSSTKIIGQVTLETASGNNVCTDIDVEYYNGSSWVVAANITPVANSSKQTFSFGGSVSATIWRMITKTAVGVPYSWAINECEMMESNSVLNMTLFSNATTALAAPDDANIVIWQQDVDSVTLNTDLKAYASRNGGTTYTQMTLAEVASLTIGRILTGTVDISGQSSATAMKYKIEALNVKNQKIHAVALQWS